MNIDWITLTPEGFYCPDSTFYLDPKRGVPRAVVSHAHADHYPNRLGEVHGHAATLDLAAARYRNLAGRSRHPHQFGESFVLGNIEITLLPAGHMLGSAQILLRHLKKDQTVLYSGDFALQSNSSCRPLAYPDIPIDLLICESTFGLKGHHSEPAQSLRELIDKTELPLLIATYALGKAQRMSTLFREVQPDMPVLVHRNLMPFHRVYQAHGIDLGEVIPYRRKFTKMGRRYAYLIPPPALRSFHDDFRYHRVFASGWDQKKKYSFLESRLDISDHASGPEIREYIEHIQPKAVKFWHGYPEELIKWCKEKGIPAEKATINED